MGGVPPVGTLAELSAGVRQCSRDCLYHHFYHPILHRRNEENGFHNDLATWVFEELRDPVLAERLSMINPFALSGLEDLRAATQKVLDRRLDEAAKLPSRMATRAFRFIQSVTVVFPTEIELRSSADLMRALGEIGDHSLYYHFVEARTGNGGQRDDFSTWLSSVADVREGLVEALRDVDFYYMTLDEIRQRLLQLLGGR
jgi:hypothetical protein